MTGAKKTLVRDRVKASRSFTDHFTFVARLQRIVFVEERMMSLLYYDSGSNAEIFSRPLLYRASSQIIEPPKIPLSIRRSPALSAFHNPSKQKYESATSLQLLEPPFCPSLPSPRIVSTYERSPRQPPSAAHR